MPWYTMSFSKTVLYKDALKALECFGITQQEPYVKSYDFKEALKRRFENSHSYLCDDADCDDPNCKKVYVSFEVGVKKNFFEKVCFECHSFMAALYFYYGGEEYGYSTVLYPHLGHNQRHYSMVWYKLLLVLIKRISRRQRQPRVRLVRWLSAPARIDLVGRNHTGHSPNDNSINESVARDPETYRNDRLRDVAVETFNMILIPLQCDDSTSTVCVCPHNEFQKLMMLARQTPIAFTELTTAVVKLLPWRRNAQLIERKLKGMSDTGDVI